MPAAEVVLSVVEIPGSERRGASLVTVGFGTTVAMWTIGYAGRLPAVLLPSPLLLLLMLAALVGGGVFLGRHTGLGWSGGAGAGAVSGVLNLLILGSFLGSDGGAGLIPSAAIWVPLSILLSAALVGLGSWAGSSFLPRSDPFRDWASGLVRVAVAATLLLLAVGGLVTSTDSGLAVVDWPNSFGYNMFLYPFSRMTGGIYYEHAHRLFGALVGLTTVVVALLLQLTDSRRWVRRLGWFAVAMVIVQGLMGGLRVTGGLTLSTSPEDMQPNLALAMAHGVFGQLFFAVLVALSAFTSRTWRSALQPTARPSAGTDRFLGVFLVLLMIGQLVLGAAQRHLDVLLIVHMATGVAVVAPLLIHVGMRAWGVNEEWPLLQRLGLAMVAALGVQIILGFTAFLLKGAVASGTLGPTPEVTVATAHQWLGGILLALAVLVTCWTFRLVVPRSNKPSRAG